MNYSLFVGSGQAFGQLRSQSDDLPFRQRSACQFLAEGYPCDVLHDEKVHTLLRVEVMNRSDVGMVEPGESDGLFVEALAGNFVREGPRGEHLNGDLAVEVFILGTINITHPAGTDLFGDAIMTQSLPNKRILAHRVLRHGGRVIPLAL